MRVREPLQQYRVIKKKEIGPVYFSKEVRPFGCGDVDFCFKPSTFVSVNKVTNKSAFLLWLVF
jgi:hypothetical protein